MKTLLSLLAACILSITTGCTNGPQFKVSPRTGANLVRVAVMAGVAPVLNKNPKYIPAAQAIGAGISAALANSPTITPDLISQYVSTVCKKNNVADEDIPLFITLAQTIYESYAAEYQPEVISSTDPNVLLYVYAFRDGLLAASSIASVKK